MRIKIIFHSGILLLALACGSSGGSSRPDPGLTTDAFVGTDTSSGTDAATSGPAATFEDGHVLINVVDAFLEYGDKAAGADAATRASLWDDLLESKYTDFFNDVIYRGKTGSDRDAFKASLIDQFWNEVAPKLEDIRTINNGIVKQIVDGRAAFKKAFPAYDPQCDYYVTIAFSFKGKAVEVAGKSAFALGLETFTPGDVDIDITIAHEQFHLYHFVTFSPSGGLYRGIWSEGMATYASATVVPGQKLSKYLGFSGEKMNQIYDLFEKLTADILENIDSTDQEIKRAYLGAEDNGTWIPPASGYYIGFVLVATLVKDHDLDTLARWDADTVHKEMVQILPKLDKDNW